MPFQDLFTWWILSISWSIAFLTAVSIYIYIKSPGCKKSNQTKTSTFDLAKDFIFVWILLGLLIFYILSVSIGSAFIFAVGNIAVETILILYLTKN